MAAQFAASQEGLSSVSKYFFYKTHNTTFLRKLLFTEINISFYPYIYLPICLCVHLSAYLCSLSSLCLPLCLPNSLSVYLSIYLAKHIMYIYFNGKINLSDAKQNFYHLSVSVYLSVACMPVFLYQSVCLCPLFVAIWELTIQDQVKQQRAWFPSGFTQLQPMSSANPWALSSWQPDRNLYQRVATVSQPLSWDCLPEKRRLEQEGDKRHLSVHGTASNILSPANKSTARCYGSN
jgi:hypothetical protein